MADSTQEFQRERLLTRTFEMSNQFADRVVLQTNSRANWALMVNCRNQAWVLKKSQR
jgi:hypothetical protein